MLRNVTVLVLGAAAIVGSSVGTVVEVREDPLWSYVGTACTTKGSSTGLLAGGADVATITEATFTAGSACAVIPPFGTSASIALRCEVDNGSAIVKASAPVAASVPAGQWCVEVRRVAAGFAH